MTQEREKEASRYFLDDYFFLTAKRANRAWARPVSLYAILNFQEFDTPRALCEQIFASPSSPATSLNAYPESVVKLRAIRKTESIVNQRRKREGISRV